MGDGNDNLSFNREIDVMKKLDHPFIIKLYEEFLENNHWYLIIEYADGGNIENLLKAQNQNKFSE